jgi:signal transduction histidine kinase
MTSETRGPAVRSISFRVSAFLFATLAVIGLLSYLRLEESDLHQRAWLSKAEIAANLAARSALGGLLFEDDQALRESIQGLRDLPDIHYVRIIDVLGVEHGANPAGSATSPWPGPPPPTLSRWLEGDMMHVSAPMVSPEGKLVGAAQAGLSLLALKRSERAVNLIALVLMLTLAAGGAALALGEHRRSLMAEELISADRLASLGRIVASVAHEINNPLSYLISNLETVHLMAQKLSAMPEHASILKAAAEPLADALDGAERIKRIVGDLKTHSREHSTGMEPVDLEAAINAAVKLTERSLKHREALEVHLEPVPLVHANEGKLVQVLVNLLINADHALQAKEGLPKRLVVRAFPRDSRVYIEVEDTGTGISPRNMRRIFEPFFTTKPRGVGTGLGLSVCHAIITSFGGTIQVRSQQGLGTTFTVILRAQQEESISPPPAASQEQRSSGEVGGIQAKGSGTQRSGAHAPTVVPGWRTWRWRAAVPALGLLLLVGPPAHAQERDLVFAAFGDIQLRLEQRSEGATPADPPSLALGSLSMLLTSRPLESVQLLGELALEYEPPDETELHAERLEVRYTVNELLSLAAGRVHQALGYYNTAFHHGALFQASISRPSVVAFEDEGGLLPVHMVGLEASGELFSSGRRWALGYALSAGNGRAPDPEDVLSVADVNAEKSVNLQAYVEFLPWGLRVGGNALWDRIPELVDEGGVLLHPELDERILAAHAVLQQRSVIAIAEVYWIHHRGLNVPSTSTVAGFLEASVLLGRFHPYARVEGLSTSESEDAYFTDSNVEERWVTLAGLRYELAAALVLKAEYSHGWLVGGQRLNRAGLQLGFAF